MKVFAVVCLLLCACQVAGGVRPLRAFYRGIRRGHLAEFTPSAACPELAEWVEGLGT